MAENEDLEVLGSVDSTRLASADEETDEGADDEVEEGQHRPIVQGVVRARIGVSDPHAVVRAAARYDLLDFVSREPSLEETFLAEYGREAVEVNNR
jgi:hypothetical protein